MHMSLWQQS